MDRGPSEYLLGSDDKMKCFTVNPQIHKFESFIEFAQEFKIGNDDLVFTHAFLYTPFMKALNLNCGFLFQEDYGTGEPSDEMIDKILREIGGKAYKRIIAVGGGSVIDIAKLLVLKDVKNTLDLFQKRVPIIKTRELVIAPTTCGTGSEVTNLSIVEIKAMHTKMGLAADELYADHTVLIPELLRSLPYSFFVFSSIDALIHSMESYLSPKSNIFTELYSIKAMQMILGGYLKIIEKGAEFRFEIMDTFLTASDFAGIAFGNTGVGAVHALSYPLGGNYHVPHGEANYQMLSEVFKTYYRKKPDGKIKELNSILGKSLNVVSDAGIYDTLESILNKLIAKNPLRAFGMKQEDIELFTDSVIETQQRLLVNNYVPFTRDDILSIYQKLY
jgi:4-hydroxybutyrate dehydrogenase